jgi:hypothetical protein
MHLDYERTEVMVVEGSVFLITCEQDSQMGCHSDALVLVQQDAAYILKPLHEAPSQQLNGTTKPAKIRKTRGEPRYPITANETV